MFALDVWIPFSISFFKNVNCFNTWFDWYLWFVFVTFFLNGRLKFERICPPLSCMHHVSAGFYNWVQSFITNHSNTLWVTRTLTDWDIFWNSFRFNHIVSATKYDKWNLLRWGVGVLKTTRYKVLNRCLLSLVYRPALKFSRGKRNLPIIWLTSLQLVAVRQFVTEWM